MISQALKQICDKSPEFWFPVVDLLMGIGTGSCSLACLVAHQSKDRIQKLVSKHFSHADKSLLSIWIVAFRLTELLQKGVMLCTSLMLWCWKGVLKMSKSRHRKIRLQMFVMNGRADLVVFQDISECVSWLLRIWHLLIHLYTSGPCFIIAFAAISLRLQTSIAIANCSVNWSGSWLSGI